ncbi:MAG: UDP-glucose 4-epimerase GalE [Tumebacillaceae bacterium]
MAVLVTGGAGYIGSHAVVELMEQGQEVIVLDNLQQGHRQAVLGDLFYHGDVRDSDLLDRIFRLHEIDAVIHFAADSLVGESMQNPLKYYNNNVLGAQRLLEKMIEHGVRNIVFSSTAATYGQPDEVPIPETAPTRPASPYGESKLAMENMMRWCEAAHGIRWIALRYFNVGGAHSSGRIGEDHSPETHLIPLVLQVALGQRDQVFIYGDDYPTEDGTCIRDYIHVMDLANAHWLAYQHLRDGKESGVYNLGNGNGFSVLQVIETARKVTGHPLPTRVVERRPGDPAILVASSEKAKRELGWEPQRAQLETIIASAWQWHQAHPRGYRS